MAEYIYILLHTTLWQHHAPVWDVRDKDTSTKNDDITASARCFVGTILGGKGSFVGAILGGNGSFGGDNSG